MNALEAAARRLLAAVDYTGAPHYNVRVRDLVTAAQAARPMQKAGLRGQVVQGRSGISSSFG